MEREELKRRTKLFALEAMRLVDEMTRTLSSGTIARQLIRSATSVGANYRAACKAKSRADFLNKIVMVEEEADESLYWLELLAGGCFISVDHPLLCEADELTAIFTAIGRSTRQNRQRQTE
jgi:four helix bundle protein